MWLSLRKRGFVGLRSRRSVVAWPCSLWWVRLFRDTLWLRASKNWGKKNVHNLHESIRVPDQIKTKKSRPKQKSRGKQSTLLSSQKPNSSKELSSQCERDRSHSQDTGLNGSLHRGGTFKGRHLPASASMALRRLNRARSKGANQNAWEVVIRVVLPRIQKTWVVWEIPKPWMKSKWYQTEGYLCAQRRKDKFKFSWGRDPSS